MNILRTGFLLASTAIVSFGAISSSLAETNWTGAYDGKSFNVFGNWDNNFNGGDLVIDGAVTVEAPVNFTVGTDINSVNTPSNGPRSLTISGGATLHAKHDQGTVAVGWGSAGTSTLVVTGNNSRLISDGWTLIGHADNNTSVMTISDGADLTTRGLMVGEFAGSDGTLDVDNATLTVNGGREFHVGSHGKGTVNLTNGSSATTASGSYIFVGTKENSSGYLNVLSGSSLTANDYFVLGLASESSGTLKVSGTGSTATFKGPFYAGYADEGTILVEDGGSVTSDTMVYVGHAADASGSITVTGATSSFTAKNGMRLGEQGSGTLTVADGATATVTGDLSVGSGIYYDDDYGTTSYNHSTATGTMTVTGTGSTLNVSGAFYVGEYGNGTVILSDGARIDADSIAIADQAASTGTLVIGAKVGQEATAAGTLKSDSVTFGAGTGGIVFNHTDTDYVFDTDVEGNGSLDFYSGKTSLTGDYSAFTGSARVNGGTMLVNTDFGQAISVKDGGTLGGSGSVGDLDFAAGSTYEVEVDADGNSDKLASTGTVTISNDATLNVRAENGAKENVGYTILSWSTLTGKFDTITENFAFLDASVSYGANDATLTLTRTSSSFDDLAKNRNQRGTAQAIEGLNAGNEVYDAVVALPEGETDKAFTQLTGEQHSNIQTLQVSNAAVDRNAASQRLRSSMGGIGGSGDQVTYGFHGEEDNIPLSMTRSPQMWAQTFGMWGEAGATENTARVTSQSKGFLVGMDAEVWRGWRTGVFAGYSQTSSKAVATNSQSDIDNYHAGVYTGTQWEAMSGLVDVNFGVSGIWHQVDTDRSVSLIGFTDNLNAQYDAATTQAFAELGYTYEFEQARIQPFAGATLIHQWTDGFTEKGGAAALSASSSDNALGMTSLGVRGDVLVGRFGGVEAALNGSAAWQHAVGDVDNSTNMRFASGGDVFSVSGTPIDRDAAAVEAGLSFTRGTDLSFVATYQGTYSENARDHGFKTGFKVKF
nr:autotransporter domain-containing protein [uncultured Cohaesibacter sp.]